MYHKKSVENFIYYIPAIKGVTERNEIIDHLNAYIRVIEQMDEINVQISRQLFQNYLYSTARKFEWRKGFIPVLSYKGLLFFIPVSIVIFWLLYYSNTNLFYLAFFLFWLYILRIVLKIRKRKVYGICY